MKRPAVLQRQGGRRIKKVPKGERTQIGVIVGGNTKARLLKSMKESGRTISREVEHLIEKAHAYDDVVATVTRAPGPPHPGTSKRSSAAMWRRIWPASAIRCSAGIDGKVWKTWAEPGFPGTQAGGDAEPEDQQWKVTSRAGVSGPGGSNTTCPVRAPASDSNAP